MKHSLNLPLFTALVLLSLTGCSTSRIILSVLEPAEITIPPEIRRISLFPGGGLPQEPGAFDSLKLVDLDPAYDYNRIKRGYMEGVYEALKGSPRYDRIILSDTLNISLIESGMITWQDLLNICKHDSTDAILLLKKAVTHDYRLLQSCGAVFVFVNHTKWSLYLPFQKRVEEEIALYDTNAFEVADANCGFEIDPSDMAALLYDAVNLTGLKTGKRLCPNWHDNVPRILFSGPESDLHAAAIMALKNDWNGAGVLWNRLAEEGDPKLASRAAFNLAVAWERDDDLDQAWSWIAYADSLYSSGKTVTYRQILADRLKKRALLNLQMSHD